MSRKNLARMTSVALFAATLLAACGKQEEKIEKAAATAASDVKATAEAAAKAAQDLAKEAEAALVAAEGYIYGYPLVTMEMTRRVMTNVAKPAGTRAPMGQFVRMREYPERARSATSPRRTPTRSTPPPGSTCGKEPWMFSFPDMKGRYFLFPMLDGWTNVFQVPGKRTTGTRAQTYAITGPGWKGDAARRRDRVQVAHRHGLAAGPHLLHRHAGGLQGGARAAGPDLGSCRCPPTASPTRRRPARSIRAST